MISANRELYDEKAQYLAVEAISRLRPTVILPPGSNAASRFFDDEYVLATLESQTSQQEFLRYPMRSIEAALLEAAKADYWYTHEKQYEGEAESDFYEYNKGEGDDDALNQ